MEKTGRFILLLGILWATRTIVDARCSWTADVVNGSSGTIQSPNFGSEYGKPANCSWQFTLPMNQKAYLLTLTVIKLKTYFVANGKKICPGSYNLAMDNEPADCKRYVDLPSIPSYCNAYFSSPACESLASSKNCEVSKLTSFPIRVVYVSDGRTDPSLNLTSNSWGFKMEHKYTKCPTETSSTVQKLATTTLVHGDVTKFRGRTTKINQLQTVPTTSMYMETTIYMPSLQNDKTSTKLELTTKVAHTRSTANSIAAESGHRNPLTSPVVVVSVMFALSACINIGGIAFYFWRRSRKNFIQSAEKTKGNSQAIPDGVYENDDAHNIQKNTAYEEILDNKVQYEIIEDTSPYDNT